MNTDGSAAAARKNIGVEEGEMEEKENSDGRQGEEAQGQMESEFKKERERD